MLGVHFVAIGKQECQTPPKSTFKGILMGNGYETIILVTDGSDEARPTEQTVLDLAKEHSSKVLIVDTVRPPSLASKWLTSNAEELFDIVVTNKQQRLQKVAEVFKGWEIDVRVGVLHGHSSEEIARAAISESASLVVRYRKGPRSRQSGSFGATARNLMRVCPCPLLFVGEQAISHPQVMACINAEHDDKENEAILAEARKLAGKSEKLLALYCWKFYGDEFMRDYTNEETVKAYVEEAEQAYLGIFDHFRKTHELSAFGEHVLIENGDPVEVIPEVCRNKTVDVVVMSSASQNHPLHRLLGSTVESVLDKLPCALLVVKPLGFKSPIKPKHSNVDSA
jgi:universal stress protein E